MLFRTYDPAIGRFLQIDPLTDFFHDLSPYHFAYNNPIGYQDATGLAGCNKECRKARRERRKAYRKRMKPIRKSQRNTDWQELWRKFFSSNKQARAPKQKNDNSTSGDETSPEDSTADPTPTRSPEVVPPILPNNISDLDISNKERILPSISLIPPTPTPPPPSPMAITGAYIPNTDNFGTNMNRFVNQIVATLNSNPRLTLIMTFNTSARLGSGALPVTQSGASIRGVPGPGFTMNQLLNARAQALQRALLRRGIAPGRISNFNFLFGQSTPSVRIRYR